MAEIVFPCSCGMILKVYGEDQVGHELVCPSCGSTVIVPAKGRAVPAPKAPVTDDPLAAPSSKAGHWFGVVYLGGVAVVTLGLVKFLLMPALAPPPAVAVARNDSAPAPAPDNVPEGTTKGKSDPEEAPRRILKKPKLRTSESSDDADSITPDVPKPKPAPAPSLPGMRKGGRARAKRAFPAPGAPGAGAETPGTAGPGRSSSGGMPGRGIGGGFGGTGGTAGTPRDETEDTSGDSTEKKGAPAPAPSTAEAAPGGPARARRVPKGEAKPKTVEKSEFQHIENLAARVALDHALSNTREVKETWTAEIFLKQAEKAGKGDPMVLADVKKLRDKIAQMRRDAP
jgi:hypothetical protein